MDFFINNASPYTYLGLSLICDFKFNSVELESIEIDTILSNTILSGHPVDYSPIGKLLRCPHGLQTAFVSWFSLDIMKYYI